MPPLLIHPLTLLFLCGTFTALGWVLCRALDVGEYVRGYRAALKEARAPKN